MILKPFWVPAPFASAWDFLRFRGFSTWAGLHRTSRRAVPRRSASSSNRRRNGAFRRMARIAGVNIPTNKRVIIALQYIHGIGPKKAEEIVEKVHIPPERRGFPWTLREGWRIVEKIN